MREPHQEAVGATIARLREQQGWSQRALARWVGLDQSAVSRIEAGHRRLSADELQRFAHALHVTADDLLRTAAPAAPRTRDANVPSPAPGTTVLLEDSRADAEDDFALPPRFSEAATEAASGGSAAAALGRMDAVFEEDESVPAFGAAPPSPRGAAPEPPRRAARAMTPDVLMSRGATETLPDRHAAPAVPGLPAAVAAVARDWFALRRLAEAPEPAQRWSTGHSAQGKPERLAHPAASLRPGAPAGDVLYDRVARFWRSELHVEPDDGPLPDLVPLLEDGYGAQVVVARVRREGRAAVEGRGDSDEREPAGGAPPPASERPVAASFTVDGVPFVFVNAARPVVLQRFALAHAFAHHVLGHGDVVDRRIEWSRNVPPEAAANDFAEEFLAPVRAVQRWYERRPASRWIRVDDLLELANAFGISVWSALYRSRAARRLPGKQFHVLRGELHRLEWELLPRQAFLGGVRDTLSSLTPGETLPPRQFGGPAVLRVPAAMRSWALAALQDGRLSLEDAAGLLRVDPGALAGQLAGMGLE